MCSSVFCEETLGCPQFYCGTKDGGVLARYLDVLASQFLKKYLKTHNEIKGQECPLKKTVHSNIVSMVHPNVTSILWPKMTKVQIRFQYLLDGKIRELHSDASVRNRS